MDLFSPFEPITPISRELDPKKASRLSHWLLYHQAFLLEQALGPDAMLATQPGRLDIAPYQLVPVMRALQMSRARLLLADGVGLGKTVEAGLILAELIARRRAHRILIVSPAGPLLSQWHREMRDRFGLRFTILDRERLQEIRYSQELGANPFDHEALGLISIDYAKQEKVLQELERSSFDIVVLDEAHHVCKLGSIGDHEDSLRRRLAEVLARNSDGLLLLTATPHDGYDPHFASLMELLDPSLVDGRGSLRGETYRRHVIRRLKRHVKDPKTGEQLFKDRVVTPERVDPDRERCPNFSRFQESLLTLVAPRLKKAVRARKYGDVLAFISLLKRSVSTVAAAQNTLEVIATRFQDMIERGAEDSEARKQRLKTLRDYKARMERYGALSYEEELDRAMLEAEDVAADLFEVGADELVEKLAEEKKQARKARERLGRAGETYEALTHLVDLAAQARREDPKLPRTLAVLQEIRKAEPGANVLVYSEYTDSQDVLVEYLKAAVERGELAGDIVAISGKDDEVTRATVMNRFASENNLVLVSTDAMSEGLNLQERCHHLVHLELPYNPNRLEQRNGRIDRYGQKQVPKVRYLYLAGTFEERVLIRLIAKYERQRSRLTFMPDTLGVTVVGGEKFSDKLIEGMADEQQDLFKKAERAIDFKAPEQDDIANPAYKELLSEVERAISGYEKNAKSHSWLVETGLNAEVAKVTEAEEARARGGKQSGVDLVEFVRGALEVEGGEIKETPDGGLTLHLSGNFGRDEFLRSLLQGLPGFDEKQNVLRVTTDPDRAADKEGEALAYLGRAHPVVRRAIDRVRNQQFGTTGEILDRRVSAATHDGKEPEILFTFLGTVESGAGREFERLLAVRVGKQGSPKVYLEHADWQDLTALSRQTATKGLWEKHFEAWGMDRKAPALEAARKAFSKVSEEFVQKHQSSLAAEREALEGWLRARAEDLCGAVRPEQAKLFQGQGQTPAAPSWASLTDPVARLAGFANDGSNLPSHRREAEVTLGLYNARQKDLERRGNLSTGEPALVGMLMLVPASQGGGK